MHRAITSGNTLILRVGTKGTYETLPLLTGYDTWLLGDVSVADEPRSLAPEVAKRLSQGAHSGSPTPDEDVFALGLALLDFTGAQGSASRETTPGRPSSPAARNRPSR